MRGILAARTDRRVDSKRRTALRTWWRRVLLVTAAYLGSCIAVMIGTEAAVLVSRAIGDDLRSDLDGIPNFRIVDSRVWAGGQPAAEDVYGKLADRGVVLIVDMRTGAPDDLREDDPELLAGLGIDYLALPVRDGHVPSDRDLRTFVSAVRETEGVVFVHCGAGVGRTSALTTAYLRETGVTPSFVDQLALGHHTLEQMWFVATGDTNPVVRRTSEFVDAPRRAWSRLRGAF